MKIVQNQCLLVVLGLLVVSCSKVENQEAAEVHQYIQTTNLDSSYFPWTRDIANGRTKRWDIELDGPIPVKFNGSVLAKMVTERIEEVLQMHLFDTSSIADLPDDLIVRGIIVSEGTAIGPRGIVTRNTCGNVSALPGITEFPDDFYDANGKISTRLYVNLSSKKCTASLEIAIHEFGHALGLGKHFPGYGSIDATISSSFWQVLYTLYTNEVGTFAEDLDIQLLDLQ